MKNMLKKREIKKIGLIMLIMLLMLVIGVVKWNGSKVEIIDTKNPPVILPVLIGGGDASWENCIKEVAMEYMKQNPDVEVQVEEVINIENVDYAKALVIEEAMGDFHGIVEMRNVEMYAEENKLAVLPKTLTRLMKETKTIEGNVYSIPRYYSCTGIIYNKEIFQKYGITLPQTYGEFLEVCELLKHNGITPLVVGGGDLWHFDNWCSVLFANNVTKDITDWIELCNKGEVHWTDEGPKQMLEDLKVLFERGYVEQNYASTTDAETIDVLTSGRAAMLCSGTWMFSQIAKTDPGFELGWFFLPNHQSEPLVELKGEWEWAITASCKESGLYDTAVDFLEFYYSSEIYKKVLQNMNGISALKTGVSYEAAEVQNELIQIVSEKGEIARPTLGVAQTPEGFGNQLYGEILKMVQGYQDVEETAKILEKEWRRRLEK